MNIRQYLVDDVHNWHKWWSIRLGALGTAIASVFIMVPDWALQLWNQLPGEIKSAIPPRIMPMIGVFFFVLGMLARVIQQSKLKQAEQKAIDEAKAKAAAEVVAGIRDGSVKITK